MKKTCNLIYLLLALLLTGIPACTDDAPGDDLAAPEMIADGANNVARTTCTVAGKFSGNLSKISEYGVKYSTSYNFPTDATTTVTFSGQPSASVSAELESLSPNTHYYYCWYATTGRTLVTSEYGEFTTTSTSKPSFSEITVDSISENFMRLRCRVIEVGDQYLVEQGVSYRVRSNAAANFIPVTSDNIDSNNEYTVDIADLSAATTYEIRPYAKNSADLEGASGMLEGYGDTQTVTTENKLSPELETYDATDVTMNSARLLAKVTSAEGSYGVITERGFCYSTTSQSPTIYDKYVVVSGTEVGTVFETTLTDLDQLTTYYVRPYAKNMVDWQERVGYGTAIEFTTSRFAAPQVSFTNQDDATVTTTSIALQAQIDNYYPTALQERGFIWSTDDKNISIDNAKSTGNYLTVTTTDKVFSGTISNLEPSTTYYIRAYAIYKASNETLSGLSEAVVYSTSDVSAGSFKNITCTNKTTTSLTLNTGVSDLGDGVLTEMGFVWRAGSGVAVTLDNCDGSQVVQSENSYDYSATLIGLQQATGYTVRGYVKTTYNWQTYIAYSDALYCETNDFTAATVKDITCTAQTISSLTVESGITDMGNGTLVEKGFLYKAGNNGTPTLENYDGLSKVEGTAQGAYSATLTGLTYSTDYRVRSYVKTTLDGKTQVAYSNILTATTSDLTGVTFNTTNCTSQTTTSVTVESDIIDMGDGTLSEKGFLWRVSDGVTPTLDNCDASQATTGDSFSLTITGLQSATTYSVRAYVKTTLNWENFVSYGDVITCTTNDYTAATLKDITCTAQTTTTLTVEGGITDMGNGTLEEKGFIWKAGNSGTPTLDNKDGSLTVAGTENSAYSATLTGLNYSTEYRIRGYVKTVIDGKSVTAYTNTISGTTNALTAATLNAPTCTAQTTSSLTIETGVENLGDGELKEKGICWRVADGVVPTLDNCDGSLTSSEASYYSYSASITGLQSATSYSVRAYVKTTLNWEELIYYSDAVTFTTNDFTAATLKDITCTAQTTTTLTVESGISDLGNGTLEEKGFIWKAGNTGTPTVDSCDGTYKVTDAAQSNYTATLSGLNYNTEYRVRSYVKTTLDGKTQVSYSSTITATTSDLTGVTFKTSSCTSQTTASLTVESGITDLGDGEFSEKGFCWRVSDGVTPTLDNCDGSQASSSTSNESFSYTITGLQSATTYSVRPYVKTTYNWEAFVSYGDVITCTTNDYVAATLKDISCTAQTTTTLTVEGGITDMGNGTLEEKGFIWKSGNSATPTLENNDGSITVTGTENSSYTATLTGLNYSSEYRIRGYVKTLVDGKSVTAYTNTITGTTTGLTATTFTTPTSTAQTTSTLTIQAGVDQLGDGEITEKGICWRVSDGILPTLDNCDGSQVSTDASYYNYTTTATGLKSATTYSIRAYVKMMINWEELIYYSDAVTCTTNDFTAATVKDITCTAQTVTSLTVESGITDLGNGELVEKGFVYKAGNSGAPTLESCDGSLKNEDATQSNYSSTLTGLTYDTEYRVRSYVKTTLDGKTQVSYSSTITATTSDLTGVTFKTSSCTSQTTASLTVESGITDLGDGEFSEKGFCWRISDGVTPTLDNCDGSQASSSTSNDSFSYTITGLQSATTYSVRPYVKTTYNWEAFVSYGDVITCTTNDYVAATLKDISCTAQTTTTLTVEGGITDMGNGTLEEKGFIWKSGNSATPTLENNDGSITVTGTENSAYTATLTGLNYSSEYRIRGYVKTLVDGKSVTAYTNTITGTTTGLTATTFTTPTSTAQTTSTLTIQAGVDKLGDGEITEKGICWRVYDGILPTLDNCDGSLTSNETSYYNYTLTATGLKSATTYSIRAYVKMTLNWETLIYYSDEFTAKTNEFVLATMKSINCTAQTTSSLTVETGISDLGSGEFVEKGFLWRAGNSGTPSFENGDSSIKVEGTEQSTYSATITGLQAGTSYRLRGYTKTICDGTTLIAYTEVIRSTTEDKIAAKLYNMSAKMHDDIYISASCEISSIGNGEFIEKGFCWKENETPTLEDCGGYIVVTDDSDNSFSAEISNLHYNSTYIVRGYAKTKIGDETLTSYTYSSSVDTKSISINYTTTTDETYIELGMSCDENYMDKITEWSATIREAVDESSFDENSYVTATKDSSSNKYVAKFTGLKGNSSYLFRMRIKYNNEYYIYQDTYSVSTLRGPSKGDIENPDIQ